MPKNFNPYDHFGFLTGRVSRLIDYKVEAEKAKRNYSFPNSCMGILANLWAQDGIKQQDLADEMIRNKSSITKMILALVNDGLVERKIDDIDRRQKRIYLTKEGREFKQFIIKKALKGEKQATKGLTAEEVLISKKVLQTIYTNLNKAHNQVV